MNEHERISPEDPRLTAYALGEMDATERDAFERLLRTDAAARAAVEEIRGAAAALGAALEDEATKGSEALAPERVREIRQTPESRQPAATLLTFPRFYYVAAGLAAACFAVFYVVGGGPRTRPQTVASKQVVVHEPSGAPSVTSAAPAEGGPARAQMPPAPAAKASVFMLVPAEMRVPDRFFAAAETTTSTFPLRVGRQSYDLVRAALRAGERPARESVHVAEMINAFNYTWPEAAPQEAFATLLEETAAPWATENRLVRVGLKGTGPRALEVARDAHVRVEFNPAQVRAWRLIGFERDGESIGVSAPSRGEVVHGGDSVTALYEIVLAPNAPAADRTLMEVSLQYRDLASGETRTLARRLETRGGAFGQASADMKFVAAVAAFGLALRDSPLQAPVSLSEITTWAEAGSGTDAQRREFAELMRRSGARLQ